MLQSENTIKNFYTNLQTTVPQPVKHSLKSYFKNFVQKYFFNLMSFFIPFILMIIIFMINGIYPFGQRSFLQVDMYHQYFPFLTEFYHKLKSGDSLFYSWNLGLGGNFLALYAYYLASPFNWLCIFVPESYLIEFQSYMVVLKTGFCGFTSYYYFHHHFHKKNMGLLFFSTFYALSGFMAAYNWNVMWLDCIFLAPLILLGLEQLAQNRTYKLYCLSLAWAILSNFYLCIMLCIYLVLYFLLILLKDTEDKFIACRDFFFFSFLAGGMAAVLLLPEFYNLIFSEFSNSPFPASIKIYFDFFDVLARHCVDVAPEIGLDHWPNIYCGAGIFVLLPLYIICKTIPTRQKIGPLFLLGFLLLSFCTNILDFLWHGFNYPNSLPARQSYLYILLLLTVSAEAFLHIPDFTKTEISIVFFGALTFLILCQKLVTDDAFSNRTFLLTILFLFSYCFLLYRYHRRQTFSRGTIFCFFLLFILESGLNTYLTSCSTVSRSAYLSDYNSYTVLLHRNSSSVTTFKRYEQTKRVISNNGTLHSYPSASYFSSTVNGLITAFYEKYGLRSSKVYYIAEGLTPFTEALLNVSHKFSQHSEEKPPGHFLIDHEGNLALYQNHACIPFAYLIEAPPVAFKDNKAEQEYEKSVAMTSSKNSFPSLESSFTNSKYARNIAKNKNTAYKKQPLENQNILAKKLGAKENIFQQIPAKTKQDRAVFTIPTDGHYYGYSDNPNVNEATISITDVSGRYVKDTTCSQMNNGYILDLGQRKRGDHVTVTAENKETLAFTTYYFKEKPWKKLLQNLNSAPFQIISFSSTQIEGYLNAPRSGYLVFSIPYEPGWKMEMDGVLVEPRLFEGMFLSLPVTRGHHQITLTYLPAGFVPGVIISLTSLGIFLFYRLRQIDT